jgi:hypothetical protein
MYEVPEFFVILKPWFLMILSGILFTIALAISSMARTFAAGQQCKMQMTENAPEAFEGDNG